MTLARFIEQLERLGWQYLRFGWPFVFLHMWLAFDLVFRRIRGRVLPEMRALLSVDPEVVKEGGNSSADSTELATQLVLFVQQSQAWAKTGVAIPVTDFSDRVDSMIDGIADDLHSRVNLFLVVGIAGTFFGLYQFSTDAAPALLQGGDRVLMQLSVALTAALSNAFPVGFVGLVLMLMGHIVVTRYEDRLRAAAADATQRCIRARTVPDLSNAIDKTIEKALQPLVSLEEKLIQALKPVENLRETLAGSLEPVVKEFTTQLNKNKEIIDTQFGALQTGVEAMKLAVEHTASVLSDVPQRVKEMAVVAETVREHTLTATGILERLDTSIERAVVSADNVTRQLGNLPNQAKEGFTGAFTQMATDARATWTQLCQQLAIDMANVVRAPLNDIARHTEDAKRSLQEASKNLYTVANNAQLLLENALKAGVQTMQGPLQELNAAAKRDFPDAVTNIRATLEKSSTLLLRTQDIVESIAGSTEQLVPVMRQWQEFQHQLSVTSETLRNMGLSHEEMEDLRDAIKKAADARGSQDVVEAIRSIGSSTSTVSGMVADIQDHVRRMRFLKRTATPRGR